MFLQLESVHEIGQADIHLGRVVQIKTEVIGPKNGIGTEHDGASHHRLKLPHIARPMVCTQRREGLGREALGQTRTTVPISEEVLRQFGDVRHALSKRGKNDVREGESKIEIFPKPTQTHGSRKVLVGRRHDSDIHRGRPPPDWVHHTFLQGAQ